MFSRNQICARCRVIVDDESHGISRSILLESLPGKMTRQGGISCLTKSQEYQSAYTTRIFLWSREIDAVI